MPHLILAAHTRLGIVLIAGFLAMSSKPCTAQILIWPPADAPTPKAEAKAEDEVQLLQIDPAAEPEPALRYRFWPIAGEETPGNAMTMIQRAIAMRLKHRADQQPDPFFENYDQWMAGPLAELPKEAVREYLQKNAAVLSELHRAASMKDSEYAIGLTNLHGVAAVEILLDEIQNARDLARLLVLEVRLARSEHRYEDAIRSLRAGFRLAESVGQATDLVMGRLVGIAIAGLMLHEVQELIAQEESPNMYWALASLPPTIWELQRVFEFETNLAGRFFPHLEDATRTPSLSDAAWQERIIDSASEFFELAGRIESEEQRILHAQLMAGALVLVFDGTARVYLQRVGYASEEVRAMSPSEAVLRSTREQLRRIQDTYFKWTLLPHRLSAEYGVQEELSLQPEGNLTDPAAIMVSLMLPAIRAAQDAALRTEQSIAFLATAEALRMYAAEQGQFPESLEHLQPVPAFPDPATGEHFSYERISNTEARLERSEVSPGQPDMKFRLELRK